MKIKTFNEHVTGETTHEIIIKGSVGTIRAEKVGGNYNYETDEEEEDEEGGENWALYSGNVKGLDGIYCQDNFVDYADEPLRSKLKSGYMSFKYNEEEEQLYTVTKYIAKEQLSESELQELADYTQGQWSDGIGEGFEQEPCCEVDGYEIYVSPWHRNQELEVIQK
jgi:hypothetical protein